MMYCAQRDVLLKSLNMANLKDKSIYSSQLASATGN